MAETIEATLRGLGYAVSRNKPYAGGFITEHYGNPAVGLHAIQLEINRALYMDERRYERIPAFERVAADLEVLADDWPTFRCRSFALPGGGRIRAAHNRGTVKIEQSQRKRAACVGKRPKSREETPRRATVARALPHRNNMHRIAQNARAAAAVECHCKVWISQKKGRLRWQAAQV